MVDILIIPDSHAKPGVENDRYEWAGRLIVDRRPDYVVDLGDFADMPSLCSYEKGKASHEGRRLLEDIAVAKDAREKLTAPLRALQRKQKEQKQKIWYPELHALGGNHEYRIIKAMNQQSELMGLYSEDVSDAVGQGWAWHPFGQPLFLHNIGFIHYLENKMCKPIGGIYPARKLIFEAGMSIVVGHAHDYHYAEHTTLMGKKRFGLVAGCWLEHFENYAGIKNNQDWQRRLTLLRNVVDGSASLEILSMEQVRHEYGGIQ